MNDLATGEPPILLSISVLFAIKAAINSARNDAGLQGQWTLSEYKTRKRISIYPDN